MIFFKIIITQVNYCNTKQTQTPYCHCYPCSIWRKLTTFENYCYFEEKTNNEDQQNND